MSYLKTKVFLALLLFIGLSHSEEVELVRDEKIIFDLLENGDLNLSESVAKIMGKKESILMIRRIGLSKDNRQIRAAFRDKTIKFGSEYAGKISGYDAYYNELAAYIISKYLGLNIIPPTVLRSIPISAKRLDISDKLRQGTLQLWLENSVVLYDIMKKKIPYPGNQIFKNRQLKEIKVFDCIIGNVDRHAGNYLVDLNERFDRNNKVPDARKSYLGKIWSIDHSRAFYRGSQLWIKHCRLSKLNDKPVSLAFMRGMKNWRIGEVEKLLREGGLSEKQLHRIHLESVDSRLQQVKTHIEAEQQKRNLSDEEFYSSGIWHRVW